MEYAILNIIIVAGFVFLLTVILFLATLINYKNKKAVLIIENQKIKEELLQAQLNIQEQTLQNVAQEIHDNTGQLLSLIKLNIATTNVNKPEQAQAKLDDTLMLVTQVIASIRQLSHTLDAGFVERMGLQQAIARQLELVEKTGTLQGRLQTTREEVKLDNQQELSLFRMVQESLNNTIKHAQASAITIQVHQKPAALQITIADDGMGFDTAVSSKGMGLQNMQNRAKLIGATLHINSEPGKGTVTSIALPLPISHQPV